jgi:hypothetical protein
MSRARQSILAAALHENDPARVLERANEILLLNVSRMVTAICGYISTDTMEIVYATAGHPPPALAFRDRPATFLPFGGLPLGVMTGVSYQTFTARALNEALLVLYTDGVIEHARNIMEGEARLLEAATLALGDENPALAIRRHVFATSSPTDDVAILTVKFTKSGDDEGAPGRDAAHVSRVSLAVAPPLEGMPSRQVEDSNPSGFAESERVPRVLISSGSASATAKARQSEWLIPPS